MTRLKSLPVDLDDFADMRAEGRYLYVDKTHQIANMILDSSRHVFLTRPRRFGKTLLVSTLEALFQGQQEMFKETWIHQNWDWHAHRYPVLRLNLALRNRQNATSLQSALKRRVRQLAGRHADSILDPEMSADEMLTAILQDRVAQTNRKAVVLIDEYDTPVTENLERTEVIEDILNVLRAFYGVLKDCSGLIRFTFVTGITRFSRVGLFSGANHLHDLSFDPEASDLVGFTRQELADQTDSGLRQLIERGARNLGWRSETLYQALEDHYNGYQFAKGGDTVYNPFSLVKCLHAISTPARAQSLPEAQLPNFWAESGSPSLLLRLLESGAYPAAAPLSDHPDMVERVKYDVQEPHFAALLYQAGYLTRKGSWNCETQATDWRLDFPNAEVAHTFKAILLDWQHRRLRKSGEWDSAQFGLAHAMHDALHKQSVSELHTAFHSLLRASHHYLHPPPSPCRKDRRKSAWKDILDYEIHYQALLYGAFALIGVQIYGELPTVAGRIDIAVELGGNITIMELKADRNAEHAVRQALSGDYPAHFATRGRPVTVFGMNIDTDSRTVTECAKWDLGHYDIQQGCWNHEPFAVSLLQVATLSEAEKTDLAFQPGLVTSTADDPRP